MKEETLTILMTALMIIAIIVMLARNESNITVIILWVIIVLRNYQYSLLDSKNKELKNKKNKTWQNNTE